MDTIIMYAVFVILGLFLVYIAKDINKNECKEVSQILFKAPLSTHIIYQFGHKELK